MTDQELPEPQIRSTAEGQCGWCREFHSFRVSCSGQYSQLADNILPQDGEEH